MKNAVIVTSQTHILFLRFIRVEKLDEKTVDWANVTERLIEFGRENSTRQNVRERWTRVIKGLVSFWLEIQNRGWAF